MRRVAIFIEDGSYSIDNRVQRESRTLQAAGYRVVVISKRIKGDRWRRCWDDGVVSYHYPAFEAAGTAGQLIEHGLTLVVGAIFTFYAFLRHRFEIFHACNPIDTLWLIYLPYRLLGCRFVFDQHDLCPELFASRPGDSSRLIARGLRWMERWSYRTARTVISTNESYAEVARTRGRVEQRAVFVVRNGPDLQRFDRPVAPEAIRRDDAEIVVGYLGNMNAQDGVDYLLDAAKELLADATIPPLRFVMIGGGASQPALVARTVAEGLADRILFTGRVPDDRLLALLKACDLCVQPDPKNPLNDVSTMNKAMEYMALSKPVVAFDLRETRRSCGDAALYAADHTAGALAAEIRRLALNPALRADLSERGRRRVETELAWPFQARHLLSAYAHASA